MRLILHVGTEKTGSTAIQQHLLINRETLAERGVHLCRSLGGGNHRALVAAFMPPDTLDDFLRAQNLADAEQRAVWAAGVLDGFAAEVAAAKADAGMETVVVSSEHFHSRLLEPDSVTRLATFLDGLFTDVSVICYLRRQDQMALSFYSQKLRAGFVPPEILPLSKVRRRADSLPPYFDFDSLLHRWSEAFGASRVRPRLYQTESFAGGDVVEDFFQTAGLGVPDSRLPRAANPSLCRASQVALRVFNAQCGGYDPATRDCHGSRRRALVDYLERTGGDDRGQLPTRDEAQAFYAAFASSNARVAARWFQRESLFTEDFSAYPDTSQPVDWEDAATRLAGFMVEEGEREALARAEADARATKELAAAEAAQPATARGSTAGEG